MIKKWTNFINENKENFKPLHYTVDIKELKPRGYTFQKLYAAEYKTYRKKINNYTIWLWVKGKGIEIDDWYSLTGPIINFIKEHYDEWKIENDKLPKPREVITLHIEQDTGEIKFKDYKEYYTAMVGDGSFWKSENKNKGIPPELEAYYKKYDRWREYNIHYETFKDVLVEIDYLTT